MYCMLSAWARRQFNQCVVMGKRKMGGNGHLTCPRFKLENVVSEYTQGLLIVPSGESVVDGDDTVVITGGRFREAATSLRGAVEEQPVRRGPVVRGLAKTALPLRHARADPRPLRRFKIGFKGK